MNKYQLSLCLLFFLCSSVYGQNYSKEFGKVGKDEIELTKYSRDQSAEAVVLFDKGLSYFGSTDNGFNVIYERTTRVKVLSSAGIKWANVEIPFYQEGNIYEKIFDIKVNTYNFENGVLNRTSINDISSFDEKLNNYWNVKKFAIPDVKEGSIIEYTYKISSQYHFNLRDWEFQWKIPVVYSEYTVKMIPFYEYTWLLQSANKFDSQTSYIDKGLSRRFGHIDFQDMVHHYVMKDVPAFTDEEFITSVNDYIIKIDFQLAYINNINGTRINVITTWDEMIKDLLKESEFGKYVEKSKKIAEKIIDVPTIILKKDSDKFNYVLDYVKDNYNWNSIYTKYALKTPDKFVKEKIGNSAEINLFTIGLLNKVGIEAYPVLISTRSNGKVKSDYPFLHFFNNVIIVATINSKKVLSDATGVLLKNDRMSAECINDKGLIVKKGTVDWVKLEALFPSETETNMQIEIKDNELISSVKTTATEYEANYYRTSLPKNVSELKEKLESKYFDVIDSTIKIENQIEKFKPFLFSYSTKSNVEIIDDKIYIQPFLNEPIAVNPLKQSFRIYPIDMNYPKKRIFHSTIKVPEGYQPEYIPKESKIKNDQFEMNYVIIKTAYEIQVRFEYYFKNSVYSSFDYFKVKNYFAEIVKNGSDKIVFSKKSLAN